MIDDEGKPRALELPIATRDGGVCITGRDSDGNDLTRIALTELSVDEIVSFIPKLEEAQVYARIKDTLKKFRPQRRFGQCFNAVSRSEQQPRGEFILS
jgi:hypothetical protein